MLHHGINLHKRSLVLASLDAALGLVPIRPVGLSYGTPSTVTM